MSPVRSVLNDALSPRVSGCRTPQSVLSRRRHELAEPAHCPLGPHRPLGALNPYAPTGRVCRVGPLPRKGCAFSESAVALLASAPPFPLPEKPGDLGRARDRSCAALVVLCTAPCLDHCRRRQCRPLSTRSRRAALVCRPLPPLTGPPRGRALPGVRIGLDARRVPPADLFLVVGRARADHRPCPGGRSVSRPRLGARPV